MRTAFRAVCRRSLHLGAMLSLALFVEAPLARGSETGSEPGSSPPAAWRHRVRTGALAAAALERTLAGAARRLGQPGCLDVYRSFDEVPDFQPDARLQALGLTLAQYLAVIVFADGADRPLCRRGDVLAVTAPGSRVVYVCSARFAEAASRDPEGTEALLIHEALHSLGLPENPPASREITRRVLACCGDAAVAATRPR